MKIALFDRILETHVVDALADALAALGHGVLATGAVAGGHHPPATPAEVDAVDAAVAAVRAAGCDALLNFRASALLPRHLRELREAGIATAVWLPDDPVLYGVAYRAVVDGYDHVLHCGPGAILRFYDARGHRPGITFPFWLDPARWTADWDAGRAGPGLLFLGNLHGPAKRDRYARLAPAAGRLVVYGKCGDDPAGIHRGELHGVDAIRSVLPLFAAGLNIPQRFRDYAGTAYDFPGLAELGTFDLPSRVLQYAAAGLPVVTLGEAAASPHFPETLAAADIGAAVRAVDALRAEPGLAAALSARARADVVRHFSARARAGCLAALFGGDLDPAGMDATAREHAYREFAAGV